MKFLMSLLIVLLVIGFTAAPIMACGHDCGNCDDADDCGNDNDNSGSEGDDNNDDDDGGHGDCDGGSCQI